MGQGHDGHNGEQPYFPSGYSPDTDRGEAEEDQALLAIERAHQGPIPAPEDLQYYSQILPDAPDRILRMAEQNAQSIRELNRRQLEARIASEEHRHREVSVGQRFGLCAVITMALVALAALVLDHPAVAGTICSVTIIGIVTVFVAGRNVSYSHRDDTEESD